MKETTLERARRAKQAMKVARRNPIQKSQENPSSLRKAINAMCFHCFGGTEKKYPDPGWKLRIKGCGCLSCPLYYQRPYQKLKAKDTDAQPENQES